MSTVQLGRAERSSTASGIFNESCIMLARSSRVGVEVSDGFVKRLAPREDGVGGVHRRKRGWMPTPMSSRTAHGRRSLH